MSRLQAEKLRPGEEKGLSQGHMAPGGGAGLYIGALHPLSTMATVPSMLDCMDVSHFSEPREACTHSPHFTGLRKLRLREVKSPAQSHTAPAAATMMVIMVSSQTADIYRTLLEQQEGCSIERYQSSFRVRLAHAPPPTPPPHRYIFVSLFQMQTQKPGHRETALWPVSRSKKRPNSDLNLGLSTSSTFLNLSTVTHATRGLPVGSSRARTRTPVFRGHLGAVIDS